MKQATMNRKLSLIGNNLRLAYACLALLAALQPSSSQDKNSIVGSKLIADNRSTGGVVKGSRSAIRLFAPAAVQSNTSTSWLVLQTANPDGQDLSRLSGCGPVYDCWLAVDPPAQVCILFLHIYYTYSLH
jgi:hypothetical protein